MTTRRGFLSLIGLGAVAGPKAVATAAKASFEDLTLPPDVYTPDGALSSGGFGADTEAGGPTKMLSRSALRALGVPDWLKEQWQSNGRDIGHTGFDPDLAACKSFSLAAKIYIQRDRNTAREEESFWRRGEHNEAEREWTKLFGTFHW